MKKCIAIVCSIVVILLFVGTYVHANTVNSFNWNTGLNLSVKSSLFQYPSSGIAYVSYYCTYAGDTAHANAYLMKVAKWAPDKKISECTYMTADEGGSDAVGVDDYNSSNVRQSYYWYVNGANTSGNCNTGMSGS